VIEVDEVVAVEAHEVVVELGSGVEAGDSTRMASLGDHAHASEVLESAVDGCTGDAGKAGLDGIENLVGRRVVVEVEDRLEDDPSLHRTAHATITTEAPEEFDPLRTCRLVQATAPRFSPSMMMEVDENM